MGQNTPATTTQNTSTSPWSQATPLLNNLIGAYGSTPLGATSNETAAANNLVSAAGATPNYGSTAASGVNTLFGNANTAPQVGMLTGGLSTLQGNLGSTASGSNLNPYTTPGFGDALNTLTQDITNNVKGVYAASGREPSGSGSFAQSLGRGLMQGEAPVVQSQYNTNEANMLNANSMLENAGVNTAGGLNSTAGTANQSVLAGLQGAGLLPSIYTAPATSQLQAAQTQQQLPYAALQSALTPYSVLGGMGSQSTGVGTQTPANNTLMNILGGATAGAGLLGSFLSDEREKDDVSPVGKTFDGQNIYRFRYKGDPRMQLGMLAQEVEKREPEAVHEAAGRKFVHYGRATDRAHKLGMLNLEAA